MAARARAKARGRGAQAELEAAAKLEELAQRCEKVAAGIKRRVAGEPIPDRLISLSDPDARPIRKGKLGKPNEFGYFAQICEVTENTKRGARGLIVPAASLPGNPTEDALLLQTVAELQRLGLCPREVALDGGFNSSRPTRRSRRSPQNGSSSPAAASPARGAPTPPTALSHRRRRQDQPPQTRLWAAPQPAQGRPRPAHLDRLVDPQLQP